MAFHREITAALSPQVHQELGPGCCEEVCINGPEAAGGAGTIEQVGDLWRDQVVEGFEG